MISTASARTLHRAVKLLRLLPNRRYRRALRHGVAAAIEHEALLRRCAARTVIDVGANTGQFSLVAAEVFAEARIHAFEPLARPFEKCRSLFADDPRVTVEQTAFGDRPARMDMHVAQSDHSSSLLPIGQNQTRLFPHTRQAGVESVDVTTLDSVIRQMPLQPPALLKIDVQGYELPVLRGGTDVLQQFDWILVEASFLVLYDGQALVSEVLKLLLGSGFRLDDIRNLETERSGRAVQADLLFSRG